MNQGAGPVDDDLCERSARAKEAQRCKVMMNCHFSHLKSYLRDLIGPTSMLTCKLVLLPCWSKAAKI